LSADPGETNNLFFENESKRFELQTLLNELKKSGRSAPVKRVPTGIHQLPGKVNAGK